jgi:putative spermidine/putrescine transport system ATP-binding protein
MSEIIFQNIQKTYAGRAAVQNLNLTVSSGELVCLLGPSGCGKTTTLRMLAGFVEPDSGDILLGGKSLLNQGPEARPTAMVFQRYTLWPHMNVFHNVAFGLKLRRISEGELRSRVGKALELVGLQGFEKRFPAQLSGGQQQRVALARALVLEPKVLLLDEPLSSLDAKLRVQLRSEIKSIQRNLGITTVFVTHDQEEAMAVADRIAVMDSGILHQLETPGLLYAQPQTRFVAGFIGEMNWLTGRLEGENIYAGGLTFRLEGANPAHTQIQSEVEVAIRPEDVVLVNHGYPVTLLGQTDLGHFLELRLQLAHIQLSSYISKGQSLEPHVLQNPQIYIRRALVYSGSKLLGEARAISTPAIPTSLEVSS